MIRRISTKWVLAVLAVVVLPFLGFAWYVDAFVSKRFADDVVSYHLLGHAADLSERLDRMVAERREDVQLLAAVNDVKMTLANRDGDAELFGRTVTDLFTEVVLEMQAADFLIGLSRDGDVLVANERTRQGHVMDRATEHAINAYPWADQPWFAEAMAVGHALIDWERSPLIPQDSELPVEDRYHYGFVHAVEGSYTTFSPMEHVGVVVALIPWSTVQNEIENYGVLRRSEQRTETAAESVYESTYAWVWARDADTILAHPRRELYGDRVSDDVGLPELVEAANASRWGMYPDYTFNGVRKKAAFRHGRPRDQDGFGWVVGVGVDFPDIYGPIHEMRSTIAKATGLVILVAVFVTIVVARRTTRPVQDLEAFTRRVAAGDLDAQVPVHGHDELADLARSFNRMTGQLKENREQLVKAEKDLAWREMARQVAHEIKNPLTPIQLSASLLRRAYDEQSDDFPEILDRTIDVVHRQVRNLRDITQDFYRFAGEHRDPVPVDVQAILDEVFDLNMAWADTEGVDLIRSIRAEGEEFIVQVDPDELRRALVNLVSNAIEAMEGGGQVQGLVEHDGPWVCVSVQDTGKGIDDEVRQKLFDPYFTTRSSGTGLGLAIVRRIVEDLGGEVTLDNRKDGPGAIAVLRLPRHEPTPTNGASPAAKSRPS